MKERIYYPLLAVLMVLFCAACNEEWTDEQYEHYVSFKAPMNYAKGVTDIYVKYKPNGMVTYQLPLIMSGSTMAGSDTEVQVAIDSDTLKSINWEYFHNRKDLYYRELTSGYYELDDMKVMIPAGDCMGILDINFKLSGIDLVDKWVLPLTIAESPTGSYEPHPRKNYKKALLRVIPFNDYSGTYSTTTMQVGFKNAGNKMTTNERTAFVVDEHSIFFYAGLINEEELERRKYKIIFTLNADGTVTLFAPDPDIHFKLIKNPTWKVTEKMDVSLPYLKHKTITIENFKYEFDDVTSVPGTPISYTVEGTVNMERKINIQIPDEDQAIEW